ncbi:hypothetical protein [Streptomyces sp. NPDC050355]|uniref:Uncharacterized protein n=1 Tax=Streptomyces sirii TaxID=3127701 RepID=A0ABZ2QRF7_9ACTN
MATSMGMGLLLLHHGVKTPARPSAPSTVPGSYLVGAAALRLRTGHI